MDYSIYENVYAGMLKASQELSCPKQTLELQYHFDPQLEQVISRYRLKEVAGECSDSQKIIRMVQWIALHCFHNGEFDNHIEPCADKLLEFSFDKDKEHGINCLNLSITLAECLLGLGIKARAMSIMPMSPYDRDNHVVCEAYASDLNKWIMVDPTYGGYVTDENGTILNLLELRNLLADLKTPVYCGYQYNGGEVNFEFLTAYYAKDLYFLECSQIQGYRSKTAPNNPRLIFAPVGFDAKNWLAASLQESLNRLEKAGKATDELRRKFAERLNSYAPIAQNINILYQERVHE